jgi:hypothetical protein
MVVLKSRFARNAALRRGFAQALDLTGAIGETRLREIRSRTVAGAFARDWSMIGGDLRVVTTRWIRKHNG